jgi:hypothetical protein
MDEGTIKTSISKCRLYCCFCLGCCSNLARDRVINSCRIWSTTQLNTPLPHSLTQSLYTVRLLWEGGRRGVRGQREGRGATGHKRSRKYQHGWLYLLSLNSIKHQERRHLGFCVFIVLIVPSSMVQTVRGCVAGGREAGPGGPEARSCRALSVGGPQTWLHQATVFFSSQSVTVVTKFFKYFFCRPEAFCSGILDPAFCAEYRSGSGSNLDPGFLWPQIKKITAGKK